MRNKTRTIAFAIALSLAGVSCKVTDTLTTPADSVVGTWQLLSINGDPLPATRSVFPEVTWEQLDEVMTFDANGTVEISGHQRASSNGFVSNYGGAGSWEQDGAQITIWQDEGNFSGISGDILTRITFDELTFRYVRVAEIATSVQQQ